LKGAQFVRLRMMVSGRMRYLILNFVKEQDYPAITLLLAPRVSWDCFLSQTNLL
jgi:hypothetical protein